MVLDDVAEMDIIKWEEKERKILNNLKGQIGKLLDVQVHQVVSSCANARDEAICALKDTIKEEQLIEIVATRHGRAHEINATKKILSIKLGDLQKLKNFIISARDAAESFVKMTDNILLKEFNLVLDLESLADRLNMSEAGKLISYPANEAMRYRKK